MGFSKIRVGILACLVVGFVTGLGIGYVGVPDTVALGIGLGFMAAAGVAGWWYYRRMQETGQFDERHERIQRKSSTASYGTLLIALAVLSSVVSFTDVDLPLQFVLWAFVFGGILVDELYIEWYRRRL